MQKIDIVDLELQYSDEFPSVHLLYLKALQESKSSKITMIHGPSETGKTSYFRCLINEIEDKELGDVPPLILHVSTVG
ncbi:unnamed protein product [Adineta ricciae]|uniref:Uncharacterized protein n=1 Tax=Adineta ricciae TaxID=249248 RepID=A0A813Y2I7_ADIRI|nr:unnamed protein product [Adineta ricciae]CAF1252647.1 unnamed protein product [Adineta ricciae]